MLKFYYNTAPNPMKVALFLEEVGLDYEPVPVDGRQGDQFKPDYVAINPNSKAPSIVDDGNVVFDSNAILLYLGEKTGKFMPADTLAARGDLLSWMMFVATGIGPYSGQSVHFRHFAPAGNEYGVNRYLYEAERHYGILNDRLANQPYMMGDSYTIVDMCVWGWARMVPFVIGDTALDGMANLKRLVEEISAHSAAERALSIKDRNGHTFKAEMDEQAKKFMFPQNERLAS